MNSHISLRTIIPLGDSHLYKSTSFGSDNLQYELLVDVNVFNRRIDVAQSVPFSYFVSKQEYNLIILKELDAFIKTNKHLPEVPSAEEFKENGYSVGEMDNLLLRKIEELTLYIIELEERMKELEQR